MNLGSNVFEVLFNLFQHIINLGSIIWNFLFQEITIGTNTISLFGVLLGGGFAVFIILYLVKMFVPLT